jgi:pyridoxal/pyridoxine/pyridoxamine kinase
MITNDQELKVTKQRIEQFQRWLAQLRRTAQPEEFESVTSGYRLEIERMQAEVLEYLLSPVSIDHELQLAGD